MRRIIAVGILSLSLCVAATFPITVPDDKVAEFKVGFLKQNPVPLDEETGQPTMTENAWIKQSVIDMVYQIYLQGKDKLSREASYVVEQKNNLIQ